MSQETEQNLKFAPEVEKSIFFLFFFFLNEKPLKRIVLLWGWARRTLNSRKLRK